MNKTKLEVIRINEDVIATSVVDSASYKHFYVSNVTNNCTGRPHCGNGKVVIKVESGSLTYLCYTYTYPESQFLFPETPNTWYVVDENGNYGICTNPSHHYPDVDQLAENNDHPHGEV